MTLISQITVSFEPEKDNTIFQESGDESLGQGGGLFMGRTASSVRMTVTTVVEQSAPNNRRRALIKFDISSIPSDATITNVEMGLTIDRQPNSNLQPMKFHRLIADWGEGASGAGVGLGAGLQAATNDATWTHRFYNSSSTWTQAGGDYVSTPSLTENIRMKEFTGGPPSLTVWSSPGLIADVQGWIDGSIDNYGWIIIGDETQNLTAKRFVSKEGANIFNPAPRLTITYTTDGSEPPVSSALFNELNTFNDWVEIYNPTNESIDLSTWSLCRGGGCQTIGSTGAQVIHGSTTIPSMGFTVLRVAQLADAFGELILQSSIGVLDIDKMEDYVQYGFPNRANAANAVMKGKWDSASAALAISMDSTRTISLNPGVYASGSDTDSGDWNQMGETPTLANAVMSGAITLQDNVVGATYTSDATITLDGNIISGVDVILQANDMTLQPDAEVSRTGTLEAIIVPGN